jgi:predicted TIM-barrel fold metal-dependent hydrolase
MIIDDNMHWLPEDLFTNRTMLEDYIKIVPRAYGEYARLATIPETGKEQIIIEKPKGYQNLNFAANHLFRAEERLELMEKAGIDIAILRIPCWQEWLSLELCKQVNDGMAKDIKRYPKKFRGLGVVPPWGDKDSLKEMERCVKDLGFVGIELAAHYGDLYLDEEEFKPFFKKVNELNIPISVHHVPLPVSFQDLYKYTNQRRFYGRCVCQATAVGRELFSEMFDEFPNVKLIHTMLGGGFFAFVDLMIPRKSGQKEEMERFEIKEDKIRGYLEKNIFFETSHPTTWGKAQLECAIKVFGADHVLFGCSYPLRREWILNGVNYIKSLDISEKDKELVLGGNAMKLFNIKN